PQKQIWSYILYYQEKVNPPVFDPRSPMPKTKPKPQKRSSGGCAHCVITTTCRQCFTGALVNH
ncbi:hypothetical protein, partial [Salmonella enterica]|uniref:hypothetical protein n=1 Tax=Salmonella enterica TaxID=28901 RepID=UPI001F330327